MCTYNSMPTKILSFLPGISWLDGISVVCTGHKFAIFKHYDWLIRVLKTA